MRPLTIFLFLTLFMTLSLRGQVIYVRSASSGSNNGTSWANAYTSLQPALAAATSGKQIWVAKGTYKPTIGTDRAVSFGMKSGVKIYGGFAGTETSISQRTNYEAGSTNETILSGDIGTAGVNIDNSYHVISNSGIDNSALLDGFTITGGYADLYSEQNYSQAMGGGMYNLNSSPTLTSCNFSNNYAYYGGGIYNETSSPSVTNCSFNHNSTLYDGGGIFNYSNSNQTVTRCNFTNNSADSGGGIANYNNPSSTISGCTFDGNLAGHGGALSNYNSSPVTTGCIFRNNSTQYGGAIYNGENSSAAITSCLFVHNSAEFGGGIENFNSSPAIINCTFYGNSSKTYLGGCAVYNDEPSRPIIKNSIFWENLITSNSFVSDIYGGVAENITYCCFQEGKTIYTGKGNIFCIPAFTDAAGDDFSLLDNSPCIGAGTTTGAPATDILGLTRGTPPDMGAYENSLNAPNIKIIYVKANATGKNDGTSWANAYTSLQPALKDALLYDQIWVAKGTYKPTIGTDRNIFFSMKNGVEIYGGFAGTEAELSFRKNYGPGEANETILSGNIGNEADSTDNSYHVFYHSEELLLDATAILDGFTITGGYANGTDDYWGSPSNHGGGMINYQASPTIRNCTFEGNCANDGGGGMFNWDHSSPLITNTLFTRNHVFGVTATEEGGGGMYNDNQSSPEITHCTFSYNKAFVVDGSSVFSNGGGGGVFNDNGSSPVIDQCRFIGNYTDFFGGGVNYYLSTANITRCVFDGNDGFGGGIQLNEGQTGAISNCLFTNNKGGGIYAAMETSANVVNCTFSKNSGDYASGLRVYNNSCSIDIINSIFWGDTQSGSNHIEITKYDNVVASNCCIQSGSDRFSGNNNIFTNPLFVDATHGDFHLSAGSPCISKGLNPAENNLIPLVDLDGNSRPLGSKTDMGAYECRDDGTVPGPTTFVFSNEGGLIGNLIASGYGNSNLYEVLVALQPNSGGIISDEFMATLAHCPAGSDIFTAYLTNFSDPSNNPIAINTDGTAHVVSVYGKDYFGREGYSTYPESQSGVGEELFTYAISPEYYIDCGSSITGGSSYKAFAIVWSQAPSSTLSVSTNTLNIASANNSTASFNVTSNSSWTAISNQTWLSVNPATVTGNSSITVTAQANPTTSTRTATVTVSGSSVTSQTVTVTQAAGAATLSVSTNTLNIASANNSTASFNVTSNSSWTAISNQTWLSVNPATVTGNSSISVTAQANPTTSTRTATVTVSGSGVTSQTVTVTQAAGAATLSVSTNTLNVASANGSTASFNVTSNSSWTATSNQTWLSIDPATGTGNGSITVTAQANPTTSTRTATVIVSGSGVTSQTVTVTQAAGSATLSVSTNTLNIAAANGSTASFNVTSNSSWTAASNQTWLSVNPTSGTGNGTVTVTAEANSTISTRTAIVTVSGSGVTSQSVTMTQSADAVSLTVSPLSLDVAAAEGSSAIFTVTSNTGWVVLPNETWLKVSKPFGSGNSEVMVIAEANSTTSQRTGTLVVSATGAGTQTVTVTQAAGAATLTVSPSTIDIAATGGDTILTIISNTNWTVASNQSWLTVAPLSGSGNGTVMLTSEANPSSSARSATVTVSATGAASQTVLISQQGTVGVLDDELAKIRVYPNPFSEGFYVNADNSSVIVTILDMADRTILKQTISSTQFIETGKLENGIYLIGITNAEQTIRKKMIKK